MRWGRFGEDGEMVWKSSKFGVSKVGCGVEWDGWLKLDCLVGMGLGWKKIDVGGWKEICMYGGLESGREGHSSCGEVGISDTPVADSCIAGALWEKGAYVHCGEY